jgi:hypothetical protein
MLGLPTSSLKMFRLNQPGMASATDCTAPPFIHKGSILKSLIWVALLSAILTLVQGSVPESLSAQAASAAKVNLSWIDTSSNETGFELERRAETETSFQKVATIGANGTQWVDEEVLPKTLYQYRVQAFTNEESSDFSAAATVQTPVAPPQITAIVPKKARPGKLVTISGNNFENAVVFFGQLRVSLATASATQLQFFVPQTPRGEVILTLTTPGGTAQINFRVT